MFSVIIPLYNKKNYIQRALDSVCAQNHPYKEIIVVNDGSSDGGDEIARLSGISSLRIIDQQNRGVSVARNRGLQEAVCEHVAFLDADDEWHPDFLDGMAKMVEAYSGAGIFGAGFKTVANTKR